MSWLSDRVVPVVREAVEERLGVTVVGREKLDALQESFYDFQQFREEASELAYHALDYFGGRPQELRAERRNRLAQRSRIALMQDPLAGAEADLLANFAYGKGVSMPTANEEKVQQIIEEAWTDPINEQKLTSFEAQRHRSNQLLTCANLFPTAFIKNGRVRLGFLLPERVIDIICDPEDDERPLFYVYATPPEAHYDYTEDRWKLRGEGEDLLPSRKLTYYPHWRNVEDLYREYDEAGEAVPPELIPPKEKLGKGYVEHIRINRIGHTQFGTPPWARTLRFYSAMNQIVEAHVTMAQAASTLIAKRVMRGGPNDVTRAANAILTQTGELGAARFGGGDLPAEDHFGGETERLRRSRPVDPGSFWVENQSDTLEPLQLNSGAAQALQTGQLLRGQVAAPSGFGQHYLGDASSANLATATSLELPTLMTVQSWQQTGRGMFTWFIDLAIQSAVRAGRLGATATTEPSDTPLDKLMLTEAADFGEAKKRTGLNLSYDFSMPYPGRRNLPDVTTLVTTVKTAFDLAGTNVPLQRKLLLFLAQYGLEVENPKDWVDEVLPEEAGDAVARQALYQQVTSQLNALNPPQPPPGQPGAPGPPGPPGQPAPQPGITPPAGETPPNAQLGAMQQQLREVVDAIFLAEATDPILKDIAALTGNGNGSR